MRKYIFVVVVVVGLVSTGLMVWRRKPAVVTAPAQIYIALGDSVAAGAGLMTDSDPSACDRTNQAYPNIVAQKLNLSLKNLACSGATLQVGILGQQKVNQLWLPSQLDQLSKLPMPSLVSLTIGANDVQWTTIISKCYLGVCGEASDVAAIDKRLVGVSEDLRSALVHIQDNYKQAVPHVVVTGYHQVFPTTVTNCTDLTGIEQSELTWTREEVTKLNKVISDVVDTFSFAKFAAVDFTNHELCTANSWVQSIGDRQPYHPTEDGQKTFANQIVETSKLLNK